MIFTSISPNTESDDVFLALSSLFWPFTWKRGKYINMLEKKFQEKLSLKNAISFQSGRNALYSLLLSLDLPADSEVLLQAYTCVAVPEPVMWVGAKPVYVDILEDGTLTMDPEDLKKKITPKSRVLIIQHTFGAPARIDEMLAIARENGLFVVEDCAHAMGAKYKDSFVGTFGDASFFSFGRDKVLSSVCGGMLSVRDERIFEKAKKIQESFLFPNYRNIFKCLLHPALMQFTKATYEFMNIGKGIIEIGKKLGFIPLAVESVEYFGGKPSFIGQKMPNALARLALHQFEKLDRYSEHREKIAKIYSKELDKPEANFIPLRYTVFVPKASDLIRHAKKWHIQLGDWYIQSVAPKCVDYKAIGYDPSKFPFAEYYASQSVNLPTHIGIVEKDVLKIVKCLKQYESSRN